MEETAFAPSISASSGLYKHNITNGNCNKYVAPHTSSLKDQSHSPSSSFSSPFSSSSSSSSSVSSSDCYLSSSSSYLSSSSVPVDKEYATDSECLEGAEEPLLSLNVSDFCLRFFGVPALTPVDQAKLNIQVVLREFLSQQPQPDNNAENDVAVRNPSEEPTRSSRRILWSALLGLLPAGDSVTFWASSIKSWRQRYLTLRQSLLQPIQPANLAKLDPQIFHPLAAHHQNPWRQKKQDEELLTDIEKDVERTFQERRRFNQKNVQKSLLRVLFVWAKENEEISYRQGMNELAGLMLLVCMRESFTGNKKGNQILINRANGHGAENRQNDFVEENQPGNSSSSSSCTISSSSLLDLICLMMSTEENDIEADSFTLFSALMNRGMKSMFAPSLTGQPKPLSAAIPYTSSSSSSTMTKNPTSASGSHSPLLSRCDQILHNHLRKCDFEVYSHLSSNDVPPQFFLLRWIRLLFCREFHVEDTLVLWDAFFADGYQASPPAGLDESTTVAKRAAQEASAALPLVDFFAIAMIHFVREHLLHMDQHGCLRRLLKFPPMESLVPLIILAHRFRDGTMSFTDRGVAVTSVNQFPKTAKTPRIEQGNIPKKKKVPTATLR